MPDEPYDLSPAAAARILGVHTDTVKRWAKGGDIPAFRTPGGWFRFRRSDLAAFVADSQAKAPEGAAS